MIKLIKIPSPSFQYFVLVTILCAAELVCGVFGFLYCENIAESLQEELLTGIRLHYNTSPSYNGITLAWDHIQYQVGYKNESVFNS